LWPLGIVAGAVVGIGLAWMKLTEALVDRLQAKGLEQHKRLRGV